MGKNVENPPMAKLSHAMAKEMKMKGGFLMRANVAGHTDLRSCFKLLSSFILSVCSRFFVRTASVLGNSFGNPSMGSTGMRQRAAPIRYPNHHAPTQLASDGVRVEPVG